MINYASGIFIIKPQRLAVLFYPAPSLNIEHVVCTVTTRLFHKLAIWQVKKRTSIADLSHSERHQDVCNLSTPNTRMFALTMTSTKN